MKTEKDLARIAERLSLPEVQDWYGRPNLYICPPVTVGDHVMSEDGVVTVVAVDVDGYVSVCAYGAETATIERLDELYGVRVSNPDVALTAYRTAYATQEGSCWYLRARGWVLALSVIRGIEGQA